MSASSRLEHGDLGAAPTCAPSISMRQSNRPSPLSPISSQRASMRSMAPAGKPSQSAVVAAAAQQQAQPRPLAAVGAGRGRRPRRRWSGPCTRCRSRPAPRRLRVNRPSTGTRASATALLVVDATDPIEQLHGAAMRNQRSTAFRCVVHVTPSRTARLALLPPNANELLNTWRTGRPSASPGCDHAKRRQRRVGLRRPTSAAAAGPAGCPSACASTTPPRWRRPRASAWPVSGLVELTGTPRPSTSATARLSIASLCGVAVPCRFT